MKRIIVYHDTEALAFRTRRPREGEMVAYCAIAQFDEAKNATFDEVINLSAPDLKKSKSKKGEGNDV